MAKIEAEDVDLADKEFTAVAACYDPYCNKLDMFILMSHPVFSFCAGRLMCLS